MSTFKLDVRNYRLYTDEDVERLERNYVHRTLRHDFDLESCAIVSLDVWNQVCALDEAERSKNIVENRIAPLFKHCREKGLRIIHTPGPPVAQKHPNWVNLKIEPKRVLPLDPEWPPKDFTHHEGEYAKYALEREAQQETDNAFRENLRDFHELGRPEGDEAVVVSGDELHVYCKREKILHLFYVGFFSNMCLQLRDYGLNEMKFRGYNVVLLRDCATSMETRDTQAEMLCHRGAVATFEQLGIYTAKSEDLIAAL